MPRFKTRRAEPPRLADAGDESRGLSPCFAQCMLILRRLSPSSNTSLRCAPSRMPADNVTATSRTWPPPGAQRQYLPRMNSTPPSNPAATAQQSLTEAPAAVQRGCQRGCLGLAKLSRQDDQSRLGEHELQFSNCWPVFGRKAPALRTRFPCCVTASSAARGSALSTMSTGPAPVTSMRFTGADAAYS
jgi:hypothetical protein